VRGITRRDALAPDGDRINAARPPTCGIRKWEVTSAGRIAVYCGGNLDRRTCGKEVTGVREARGRTGTMSIQGFELIVAAVADDLDVNSTANKIRRTTVVIFVLLRACANRVGDLFCSLFTCQQVAT